MLLECPGLRVETQDRGFNALNKIEQGQPTLAVKAI